VTEVFLAFPQFLANNRLHLKGAVPSFQSEGGNCLHSISVFKSLAPFSHFLQNDNLPQVSHLKPVTCLYYEGTKAFKDDKIRRR